MNDRLEEIKRVHNAGNYAHRIDCRVCWLIARVEELELTIDGIMHSVDKWLEGDQLNNDPVTRASDARETALRVIDRLETEIAKYKIKHDKQDLIELAKQAKSGSLAAKQAYINGLEFELAELKREREFGPGTKVAHVGPVAICCMDPEYRDCLDLAIEQWKEHWKKLPPEHRIADPDDVYGFAYWLMRWSGLVVPAEPK